MAGFGKTAVTAKKLTTSFGKMQITLKKIADQED